MLAFGQTKTRNMTRSLAIVLALCALVCAQCFPADRAHAYFNRATDQYYAAQDLAAYGAPIYGDQLPDDVYTVSAISDSNMCNLYSEQAGDASKYQAKVIVSEGSMTAVFYTSGRYNYIYPGTMEDAAGATNADGTDASAYYAGDPEFGYVRHGFAIPIPGLNVPMTIATYSGGYEEGAERSLVEGMWWTRQVVFCMTDEEFQAIAATSEDAGTDPVDDSDEGGSQDQGQEQSADGGQSQPWDFLDDQSWDIPEEQPQDAAQVPYRGDSNGEVYGDQDADGDDGPGDEGDDGLGDTGDNELDGEPQDDNSEEEETPQSQEEETQTAEDDSESAPGDGSGGSDDPNASEDGSHVSLPNSSSSASGAGLDGMPSVRFRLAKAKDVFDDDVGDGAPLETPEEVEKPLLTQEQILAIAIMSLFGAGIIGRVIMFLKGFESFSGLPAG